MTTNSYLISEAVYGDTCASPALRELLLDYLADQLADAQAEALEEHLLDCPSCRETYLEYTRLLGNAYAAFERATTQRGEPRTDHGGGAPEADAAPGGAKVLRLEEFRNRRS